MPSISIRMSCYQFRKSTEFHIEKDFSGNQVYTRDLKTEKWTNIQKNYFNFLLHTVPKIVCYLQMDSAALVL